MPGSDVWGARWFSHDEVPRIVVGRDFAVLAMNEAARELLQRTRLLAIRENTLHMEERRDYVDLAVLIGKAKKEPHAGVVGVNADTAILVEVDPVTDDEDGPVGLALRDLSAPIDIECANLDPVFGVTRGEQQVLVELLKGRSSQEIADESGKSILTVRTHLKRAYYKIHVNTRGQLFARLLPYLTIRSPRSSRLPAARRAPDWERAGAKALGRAV